MKDISLIIFHTGEAGKYTCQVKFILVNGKMGNVRVKVYSTGLTESAMKGLSMKINYMEMAESSRKETAKSLKGNGLTA